jgi:hypothetical protein
LIAALHQRALVQNVQLQRPVSGGEVDVRLESHRAAMATAVIRLFHGVSPESFQASPHAIGTDSERSFARVSA